ncbi:hypothetical protein BCD49_33740 [Pseudofrankia sp. EUN1h]|nr:hypothetical protein BCD49_33740 [Pseudofrankia sp. EUN1h]
MAVNVESQVEATAPPLASALPASVRLQAEGQVLVVTPACPHKRNTLDDATIHGLERVFREVAPAYRAAVLAADGDHFSAGLDLHELADRDAFAGVAHSQFWHRALDAIEGGPIPSVAALTGAVVGGGPELAAACATSGSPTARRSTPYPRDSGGSSSAGAGRCGFPGSSAWRGSWISCSPAGA